MKPVNNWSLFGDLANEFYWIRWPPVLATRTLTKLGFGWAEQAFVAAFLVKIKPFNEEVKCNVTALAESVGVSPRTLRRAMEGLFSAGLVRDEDASWSNAFQARYTTTHLLRKLRDTFALVLKESAYHEGETP